jgi:hypothetical protein
MKLIPQILAYYKDNWAAVGLLKKCENHGLNTRLTTGCPFDDFRGLAIQLMANEETINK